ncbi:PREDICTED: F-box [Prunus dulcis]|uniref:PREDICTED: F-box n=1 Tax=Prunus dulcis TaxID=3755 RepID=A0A5E4FMX6_PRUDU|nr:PREDICTED: F-box [Prunus dulcis]
MLDLYELAVKFGEGFVNDQFDEDFVDDQFCKGFADDVQLEDEDEVEFIGVDVQVEDEDGDDDEEKPSVKDYVYKETKFEQSDEENEWVYGGFVVNEDEKYHEKEPSKADTNEHDTDERAIHWYSEEQTTLYFNVEKECFNPINGHVSVFVNPYDISYFGQSGGHLRINTTSGQQQNWKC